MRSYCAAQGTMSKFLGWNVIEDSMREGMPIYIYDWVTVPCRRNRHNNVNQLYFNKKRLWLTRGNGRKYRIRFYKNINREII